MDKLTPSIDEDYQIFEHMKWEVAIERIKYVEMIYGKIVNKHLKEVLNDDKQVANDFNTWCFV